MALHEAIPPAKCEELIRAALSSVWDESYLADQVYAGGHRRELSLAAPHPVYLADVNDVVLGDLLAQARLSGWRYLLFVDEQPIAAAELVIIREPGAEHLAFSHFDYGPFVANTVEAVRRLESRFLRSDYELRALSIPALYIFSLWFYDLSYNGQDLLTPVPPTHAALQPYLIYTESGLVRSLKDEANTHMIDYDRISLLAPDYLFSSDYSKFLQAEQLQEDLNREEHGEHKERFRMES